MCILPTQHVYFSLSFSQPVPNIPLKIPKLFIFVGGTKFIFCAGGTDVSCSTSINFNFRNSYYGLFVGLPPKRHGFNPRPNHAGSVVDPVAVGDTLLPEYLGFRPSVILHRAQQLL